MKNVGIIFIAILIISGCSQDAKIEFTPIKSGNEKYEVILMGGQSNMVGSGELKDLTDLSFQNVTYFDFGLTSKLTKPLGRFGPEVGIAKELSQKFPNRNFILIKYAIGGASLLDWSPNYSKEKANITGNQRFGNMYKELLTLTDSITLGKDANITALVWMQGERDARVPEAGNDYYNNFELLINSIRNDLGKSNLPIIFGKINPPKEIYPALDKVVNAQILISREMPNAYIIDTENIEKSSDKIHYSSNGQIELGIRFGKKISEIIRNAAHNKVQNGK